MLAKSGKSCSNSVWLAVRLLNYFCHLNYLHLKHIRAKSLSLFLPLQVLVQLFSSALSAIDPNLVENIPEWVLLTENWKTCIIIHHSSFAVGVSEMLLWRGDLFKTRAEITAKYVHAQCFVRTELEAIYLKKKPERAKSMVIIFNKENCNWIRGNVLIQNVHCGNYA